MSGGRLQTPAFCAPVGAGFHTEAIEARTLVAAEANALVAGETNALVADMEIGDHQGGSDDGRPATYPTPYLFA